MNITYTQNGDYLIPSIVIRKTKPPPPPRRAPQSVSGNAPPDTVQ